MRILIATSQRGVVGGVETYLRALIPALLEREHQIAMLYDYDAAPECGAVDPPGLPFWFSGPVRERPELWHELDRWKPDVVYSHGMAAPDMERRLQDNFGTVRYVHTYWGTCTTGRKCHAFPNIQSCQRAFGPMCLVLHYPRRCGGLNPSLAWRMFQSERINQSLLVRYPVVLVASKHMYAECVRNGVTPERLHVIRLPLTGPASPAPPAPKAQSGRLLFVGRLTDVKGADYLIRAMAQAGAKLGRRLTLTAAGEGAEREKLEKLARREKAEVEFCGWVDTSQRIELMRQADLLVVPSLWPEPFGLVGIEAGSLCLPAVGFATGGIPDWLIPGETGELAPADPPTVPGLRDAIVRALGDPDHYQRLCRGAFEFSRRFALSEHLGELEAILDPFVRASKSVPRTPDLCPSCSSITR